MEFLSMDHINDDGSIENWVWRIIYGIGLRRIIILKDFKYYVLIVTWQRPIMDIVHIPC
jgi:hypothetical protein